MVALVALLWFPFSGQNYFTLLCVHFWVKLFVTVSYFPLVAQPLSTTPIKAQLCGGTIRVNLTNKTKKQICKNMSLKYHNQSRKYEIKT